MYAFGRIELQMACTDSMEMVSLLSELEYVCEKGENLKQQMLDLHHFCDSLVTFVW
jgi:hypothetical protein